jgi:hypothetical protein
VYDPKAPKHSTSKTFTSPKSTPLKMTAISARVPSQDQIRERAYQLYERRGCQHGQAQQDWLMAEQQILNQHR